MMSLEKMDQAASRVSRCRSLVALLEAGGAAVGPEQVQEVLGLLRDELVSASTAIESAYASRTALACQQPASQGTAPCLGLVSSSRPTHKPAS